MAITWSASSVSWGSWAAVTRRHAVAELTWAAIVANVVTAAKSK